MNVEITWHCFSLISSDGDPEAHEIVAIFFLLWASRSSTSSPRSGHRCQQGYETWLLSVKYDTRTFISFYCMALKNVHFFVPSLYVIMSGHLSQMTQHTTFIVPKSFPLIL